MSPIQKKFKDALKFKSPGAREEFERYMIHSDIMHQIEFLRRQERLGRVEMEGKLGLKPGEYEELMRGDKLIDFVLINKIQHLFDVKFVPMFEKIRDEKEISLDTLRKQYERAVAENHGDSDKRIMRAIFKVEWVCKAYESWVRRKTEDDDPVLADAEGEIPLVFAEKLLNGEISKGDY